MVLDAPITLVTSDRENLSCALDRTVGPYRCRFRAPGRLWPEPSPPKDLLAPYVTLGRQVFLVPGLFEMPDLSARRTAEEQANVPPERLRRFVARCKLRLVERIEQLQTRWSERGNWGRQDGVWIAEPISCKVD